MVCKYCGTEMKTVEAGNNEVRLECPNCEAKLVIGQIIAESESQKKILEKAGFNKDGISTQWFRGNDGNVRLFRKTEQEEYIYSDKDSRDKHIKQMQDRGFESSGQVLVGFKNGESKLYGNFYKVKKNDVSDFNGGSVQ